MLQSKYRNEIDGLRALAVISVVIYHAFKTLLPSGFLGVDVFFVISGYVISRMILPQIVNNTFSLLEFYKKRIKRLYPALITIILFAAIFGYFFVFSDEYQDFGINLSLTALYLNNIYLAFRTDYFHVLADQLILLHLWSLAVEEQFYIIFPVIFIIINRYFKNYLLNFILTIIGFSFLAALILYHIKLEYAFYLPFGRFWEMMLGVLVAFAEIKNKNLGKPILPPLVALALIVISFCLPFKFHPIFVALPVLATAYIIAYVQHSPLSMKFLQLKPLLFFGKISYTLYLWHWVLFSLQNIIEGTNPSVDLRLLLIALSILLAWLTTLLIEQPLRLHKGKNVAPALLACLSLLSIGGAITYFKNGYPLRELKVEQPIKITHANISFKQDIHKFMGCYEFLKVIGSGMNCSEAEEKLEKKSLLIGDSTSLALYETLNESLKNNHQALSSISKGGCPVFKFADEEKYPYYKLFGCQQFTDKIEEHLFTQNYDYIYIAVRAPINFETAVEFKGNKIAGLNYFSERSHNYYKNYAAFLEKILTKYDVSKIKLIIQAPEHKVSPRLCITRPLQRKPVVENQCVMPQNEINNYDENYIENMKALVAKFKGLQSFETHDLFCKEGVCSMIRDDKLLYRDYLHLSYFGNKLIAERISQSLKATAPQAR